jgi:hypothetical protein
MSKDRKIIILIIIASIATVTYLIYHYEQKISSYKALSESNYTPVSQSTYSDEEIRSLIKKLPTYQGDSITIDERGKLVSKDQLIQSVIEQMYIVPANLEGIRQSAKAMGRPEQYYVYKTAIEYFIAQYGDRKKAEDSLKVK